jgi:hypothetical protein
MIGEVELVLPYLESRIFRSEHALNKQGLSMVLNDISAHDKFMVMLEWFLALEERHGNALQPGLVYIAYDPTEIRDLTYGASDAANKLSEVRECLQKAFRTTDVIARQGLGYWILTPFTQIDPVIGKVRQVLATAPQNGLAIAHSNVRIFMLLDHMPARSAKYRTGREFLEYLLTLPPVNVA